MKPDSIELTTLLKGVHKGEIQLPEFQRSWVWDDEKIKSLIDSLMRNYPMGAVMLLENNHEQSMFKARPISGTENQDKVFPEKLVLDGQQRLTSLYNVLYSEKPVEFNTSKKDKKEKLYYYIDMKKAVDAVQKNSDEDDIIISVHEDKIFKVGKTVVYDLSSAENEYKYNMFPLNCSLVQTRLNEWENNYFSYHDYGKDFVQLFSTFKQNITTQMSQYKMPSMIITKDTPAFSVCQIFEKVNLGGVVLTIFDLLTARFAMHKKADDSTINLLEDWKYISENEDNKKAFCKRVLLKGDNVKNTDFLTALTLLSTYRNSGGKVARCKREDILELNHQDYLKYKDTLVDGFIEADNFLNGECVYSTNFLPYSGQIIPLATIFAELILQNKQKDNEIKSKLSRWYWCGVFGEVYKSSQDTHYANDVVQVLNWINNDVEPKMFSEISLNAYRILTFKKNSSRSAVYKGVMVLIMKNSAKDFITGKAMDFTTFNNEKIDIHHIFPQKYCKDNNLLEDKWNCVVNKTPISDSTNRIIKGDAPSEYLKKIEEKYNLQNLDERLKSHFADIELCRADDFDSFIKSRATKLLDAIEKLTLRKVSERDSEEITKLFGGVV